MQRRREGDKRVSRWMKARMRRSRREGEKWWGPWTMRRVKKRKEKAFESPRAGLGRDQHTHSQAMTVVPFPPTQLVLRCPPSGAAGAASTPSSKHSPSHTPSPIHEYFLLLLQEATCHRRRHSPPRPSICTTLITLLLVAYPSSLPALPSSPKAALPTLFVPLAPPPTQSQHHPSSTDALPAAGKSAKLP